QTLDGDLQQRQRHHLRHPRPAPAPRRDRSDRGQELPHQGPGRAAELSPSPTLFNPAHSRRRPNPAGLFASESRSKLVSGLHTAAFVRSSRRRSHLYALRTECRLIHTSNAEKTLSVKGDLDRIPTLVTKVR